MRPVLARRLLVAVVAAFAALPVGSALADIAIGQVGGSFGFPALCSGVLGATDTNYVVPAGGGVINSFSIQLPPRGSHDGAQAQFLVLRPTGGGTYEVVGHTADFTLGGPGQTGTQSFPANILVQGGDLLGLWLPADNGFLFCVREARPGGLIASSAPDVPAPGVGQTLSLVAPENVGLDLNESANLEGLGSGPPPPPTSKDQCKNGGWRSFSQFKNQGDCVSFGATGGKNPPSGS
jgi:hypothetical protein